MSTVIYSTSDKNGAFAGLAYKPLTASSNDSSVKYSIGIYFTYDAFDEGGGGDWIFQLWILWKKISRISQC